jgi:hypothetical protein
MSDNHANTQVVRELADQAVADHGQLTAEELDALRRWNIESDKSISDAAKTTLGPAATKATLEDAVVVHSGYDHGRRA